MKQLILIRGLPGSGKSTLARRMLKGFRDERALHIEADMYHTCNGEYNFVPENIERSHRWCQRKTDVFLDLGGIVIVSNTFTTKQELHPYFDIARSHKIVPNVIMMTNNYGSIHNVPEKTLIKMKNRFENDISELFDDYVPRKLPDLNLCLDELHKAGWGEK